MITVLVTRPAHQADNLCALVSAAGMQAVRFPLLAIEGLSILAIDLEQTPVYDWWIFMSANAVSFALNGNDGKIRHLCGCANVAAVGQATAKALSEQGITVALVPNAGFNSEALLAAPELQQVAGKRFLCVRGQGGREILAETLHERGAQVDYLEVYRRVAVSHDLTQVQSLVDAQALNVIQLTSGEALTHLLRLFEQTKYLESLREIPIVVISERLQQQALASGFKRVAVSANPGDTAVINTIISLVGG